MQYSDIASIPMHSIGPVKITGNEVNDEVMVPLATFESPLWPSTNRGAKVSRVAGGIETAILEDCMTRSVVVEAETTTRACEIINALKQREAEVGEVIAQKSRFARFKGWHFQLLGNLVYIRLSISSGDASGHNMVTASAEAMLNWILCQYTDLKYVSISANFCVDKKVSSVNGILGRGKYVVSEINIPRDICRDVLKTTPEKVVDLHIKKNLIGTMLAGGVRTANAHFANILLGFYLATGQDAANIVEGSQGIVHAAVKDNGLYFSVTLPNVIVGSIGNGKDLEFTKRNLEQLGCLDKRDPGKNARRLAIITGATVLCGELSLLAAQTNPGELMRTHHHFERDAKKEAPTKDTTEAFEPA